MGPRGDGRASVDEHIRYVQFTLITSEAITTFTCCIRPPFGSPKLLKFRPWNDIADNDLVADAAKPLVDALKNSRNATLTTIHHSGNRTAVQITFAIAATGI